MTYLRRLLGQHFLKSSIVAAKMIDELKKLYEDGDLVLEIGTGHGILTIKLLENNINFISIEKDKKLYESFVSRHPEISDNLICGDFRRIKISEYGHRVIIFGSFPYIITSEIIDKAIKEYIYVKAILGLFQWEVARRLTASPSTKEYGALTVSISAGYEVKIISRISPENFVPPPSVDSALVVMIKKEEPAIPHEYLPPFAKFVRRFFSFRRKMIRNSSRRLMIKGIDEEYLQKRPEELTLDDFVYLFKKFYGDEE